MLDVDRRAERTAFDEHSPYAKGARQKGRWTGAMLQASGTLQYNGLVDLSIHLPHTSDINDTSFEVNIEHN